MASNASTNITSVFAISKTVLKAQEFSNIAWTVLCVLGFAAGTLQIITTIFWKPLRKVEQILVFVIAIFDWLKSIGFGYVVGRRLYETSIGSDDVSTQQKCLTWLVFMVAPNHIVYALMVAISAERLLGLAAPVWYQCQRLKFRLYLIGSCILIGSLTSSGMFIGASPTLLLPACAFASSPLATYRTFAQAYENGATCVTLLLNLISCGILAVRWRNAVKAKRDMKEFRKTVQYSALKVLTVLVTVFLLSTATAALWAVVINSPGWDDAMRMSYGPLGGCFLLLRGVIDFPCYVIMTKEYRNGFKAVILKHLCGGNTVAVVPSGSSGITLRHISVQKAAQS